MVWRPLVDEYRKSNLVENGADDPITMRVYAEQDGSLTLKLESLAGDNFSTDPVAVSKGWNNVSFDVSDAPTDKDLSADPLPRLDLAG